MVVNQYGDEDEIMDPGEFRVVGQFEVATLCDA